MQGPSEPQENLTLPAIAAKADDLEEIKKAVEDAASVGGGLWLSYLFVLSYIAIAAGAVTHEDLLLVRPVKLPFLNVELPLKAFFALAPFVVFIIHAYALMHFIMLGKKASRFHNELRRQFPDSETSTISVSLDGANKEIRDKLRRLLPSNIFVQILAGPPELRTGIFGSMLKLIALTTLVAFPILLLLLLQIQFLPFHDVKITWAQRAALILDFVLLWLLRPPIFADLSVEFFRRAQILRAFGFGLAAVMSVAALWFSIVVATIPGEWQETALAALDRPRWQIAYVEDDEEKTRLGSTHDLLFAGEVDKTTRRRKSLFSNTLVLPGFNLYEALKIDDPKKLAWREHFYDLRGRHVEQAVLDGADLTKADLTGAQLQGASLKGARLRGADLKHAQLQGADLYGAQLQSASLQDAQLQGADLSRAKLQGAGLYEAQLQGASLFTAELQGAALDDANLQGALLANAQLQGADLANAQLQGASLSGVRVKATDFRDAFLWRTYWGEKYPAILGAVLLEKVAWGPAWRPEGGLPAQWTDEACTELRGSMNIVPEGKMRDEALEQIETLDCANPDKTLASCDPNAETPPLVLDWQNKLEAVRVDDPDYETALAKELRSLVCESAADSIYILRGMLNSGHFRGTGSEASALVDFIKSEKCAVSISLTDDDKANLMDMKRERESVFGHPPTPKQEK